MSARLERSRDRRTRATDGSRGKRTHWVDARLGTNEAG